MAERGRSQAGGFPCWWREGGPGQRQHPILWAGPHTSPTVALPGTFPFHSLKPNSSCLGWASIQGAVSRGPKAIPVGLFWGARFHGCHPGQEGGLFWRRQRGRMSALINYQGQNRHGALSGTG